MSGSGHGVILVEDDDHTRERLARTIAGHPQLSLTLEWSDESGAVAERVHYLDGAQVATADVDPYELEWMEWEEDDDD